MNSINFKKIKIISIIIVLIIIVILVMYYLLFCRDLKCSRYAAVETPKEYLENIFFKFNRFGKVINGKGEKIYEFASNEEAVEYKKILGEGEIIDNKIIINYNKYDEVNIVNKSRREIKKIYKEYGYACK